MTYPVLSEKVSTMSDFYHPGTNTFLERIDFCRKFDVILNEETYTEFRYIFQLAKINLGLTENDLTSWG